MQDLGADEDGVERRYRGAQDRLTSAIARYDSVRTLQDADSLKQQLELQQIQEWRSRLAGLRRVIDALEVGDELPYRGGLDCLPPAAAGANNV